MSTPRTTVTLDGITLTAEQIARFVALLQTPIPDPIPMFSRVQFIGAEDIQGIVLKGSVQMAYANLQGLKGRVTVVFFPHGDGITYLGDEEMLDRWEVIPEVKK